MTTTTPTITTTSTTTSDGKPTPAHLTGNRRPVSSELTAFDLPVTGSLPAALDGTFLRNGPNPHSGSSPHWFFGDGMIHGLRLRDGRAEWYRNRYVRTDQLAGRPKFDADGALDLRVSAANTHVVRHAGRILALEETALPYELDEGLTTLGPFDFGGALTTAMSAHPKACPVTGELHFFGYGFTPPFLTYHVADAQGRLITTREVEVPAATMMHDFNITRTHVVFMDLPMVFDLERAMAGTMPFRFEREYGARLGVLRRDDPHGAVRWFEVDPCYVFHPLNSYDDGDTIVVDVVRYPHLWLDPTERTPAVLWRWTIDLVHGTVTETQLDDRPCEFPRVDDRLVGLPAAFGWATAMGSDDGALHGYDLRSGDVVTHHFGPGRTPGEGVFAPADDRPGGDGWVLTFVHDRATDRSDLVVLDAARLGDDPVATVHLPARVPDGFHGSWLPG